MAGIYIHIPFCKQACHYCDFHFSTQQDYRDQMVESICKEIRLRADYLHRDTIGTIYLGGGTPSLLSDSNLHSLLENIRKTFIVEPDPEITLEANPDDLTKEKLHALRQAGVNRLSIGIQSFDNSILSYLNRAHDGQMALRCVMDARESGFENISLDLIYAIPGLGDELWKATIDKTLELHPQHISSYAMTIEEKTVFGNRAKKGTLKVVEDDKAATQLQILVDLLEEKNYEQYEVSNFSLPHFRSRHNSSYWRDVPYVGVGPSAHSYDGRRRAFNIRNNQQYLRSISRGEVPLTQEILSRGDKINEYLLTSLRTSWGLDLNRLKTDFAFDLFEKHASYLRILLENNLGIISNDTLVLTKAGKLLADKIASDLFEVV